MANINVGDLVVSTTDHSVIGQVLPSSDTDSGLAAPLTADLWADNLNADLLPIRWYTDGEPYEWWERPEFLIVVRSSRSARETTAAAGVR